MAAQKRKTGGGSSSKAKSKTKIKARPRKSSATSTRAKSSSSRKSTGSTRRGRASRTQESVLEHQIGTLIDGVAGLTSTAWRLANKTRQSASRAINRSPEQLRMMAAAGESLRDTRKVLGLTVGDVTDALNLKDRSIWQAIEEGRETLSFELILRLASLYARNDPLPFVLQYTRTYHPRIWDIMHELGVDALPLAFERERAFINIYRRHDAGRQVSDAGFERILGFTQQAFDLALQFVAEQEQLPLSATHADENSRAASRAARKRRTSKRKKS